MRFFQLLLALNFCVISFGAVGQGLAERREILAPLHPFIRAFDSYYLQYEHYVNNNRSWLATAGYKGDEFLYLFFRNTHYKGSRLDVGHRFYMKTEVRWIQMFGTANLNLEAGRLTLGSGSFVPADSLKMRGVMIGPELNFGGKVTIMRRASITVLAGYRYYFNTFNAEGITRNPQYWQFNDWDNRHSNWQDNRRYVETFKKGRYPIIQLNVGYVIGLRQKGKHEPN